LLEEVLVLEFLVNSLEHLGVGIFLLVDLVSKLNEGLVVLEESVLISSNQLGIELNVSISGWWSIFKGLEGSHIDL
jgi:hypothetical protein